MIDFGSVVAVLFPILAGAIAGGIVSEWRARAAERREDERELRRLRREETLMAIEDTRGDYIGAMDYLLARALGDRDGMLAARQGNQYFPRASIYLIGDERLLRRVIDLRREWSRRDPGSVSQTDMAILGAQRGHVMAALDHQKHRVLAGVEPLWPSPAFVEQAVRETGEQFAVPDEHRPSVDLTATTPEKWRADLRRPTK